MEDIEEELKDATGKADQAEREGDEEELETEEPDNGFAD